MVKCLEPIWATKSETASRVRGRIESVLDFAKVRGSRQGENPARWKGHLDNILPKRGKVATVKHHAAIPYQEMASFLEALRQQEGTAARCLEFTILTVARTGEALGTTWSEVDMVNRVWTIPAERMKGGREHRVPLTSMAITLLEGLATTRQSDFVFPGQRVGKPMSQMSMLMLLRRMKREDLTVHGFRSSALTEIDPPLLIKIDPPPPAF